MEKLKRIFLTGLLVLVILSIIETILLNYIINSTEPSTGLLLLIIPMFLVFGFCGFKSYRVDKKLTSSMAIGALLGLSMLILDSFSTLRISNFEQAFESMKHSVELYVLFIWSGFVISFLGGLISKKTLPS